MGDQYTWYLLNGEGKASCVKLGEALGLDNKQINRYLELERKPKELFDEIGPYIISEGGQLCIDDTTLLKEFSKADKCDLVAQHWSGRYKKVVRGINLVTLFYVDEGGARFPINWRVYDPIDEKSKNDYFVEMLEEVISWGVKPSMVSGDSWYASAKNLRFITKLGMGFCFSLKDNRLVKREGQLEWQPVSSLTLSSEGEVVTLKHVGVVKVFEHQGFIHAYRPPNQVQKTAWETASKITRSQFNGVHRNHWSVEEYHRVAKQVCKIEKHIFRKRECVCSHIFFALRSYCVLEVNVRLGKIKHRYQHTTEQLLEYRKSIMSQMSLQGLVIC